MNASKRYLAMASSLGMHQGTISPSRRRGGATRCMLPAGPKLGRRAERGGRNGAARLMAELWDGTGGERRTELRGGGAKRGQAELRGTGGVRRGGKRWRVGIPRARVAGITEWRNFRTSAKDRSSHRRPPKTKEGERTARLPLLFCLRLEWPQGLRGNKAPAFGILLGWGFRVRQDALHVRFANRQSTREDPRAHWRKPHHKQTVSLQQSPRLRPWGTLQHSRRKRCRPLRLQPCIRRLQPRYIPGGKRRCKCRSQCTHRQ